MNEKKAMQAARRRSLTFTVVRGAAAIGIAILVYVFTGFETMTYIVGIVWLIIGLIVGAVKSKGFKEVPEAFKHLEV